MVKIISVVRTQHGQYDNRITKITLGSAAYRNYRRLSKWLGLEGFFKQGFVKVGRVSKTLPFENECPRRKL